MNMATLGADRGCRRAVDSSAASLPLQMVLEDANIKLASVVTDIRWVSARAMREALIAVGHTILSLVYTLLTRKQPYQDLGVTYFNALDQHRVEPRLVRRLERMGYQVS
jgi:hypothetical protein